MTKEQFLDNIEEYITGELPISERKLFEEMMYKDVNLKTAFEKRQETIQALRDYAVFEDKKALFRNLLEEELEKKGLNSKTELQKASPSELKANNKINQQNEEEKITLELNPPSKFAWIQRIAAIFVLALCLGLAYMAYEQFTKLTPQQLAMQYVHQTNDKALDEISVSMGGGIDEEMQIISDAEDFYRNGKAQMTITYLSEIPETPDQPESQFYKATLLRMLAYFDLRQLDNAREQMQLLAQHPNLLYQKEVEWYGMLALLHDGKVGMAKVELEGIIQRDGPYAKHAEQVLKEL